MTSEELQEKLTLSLMKKLPLSGLTLFTMTWKPQVTPSGRLFSGLQRRGAAHPAAVVVRGRRRTCRTLTTGAEEHRRGG